jgi:cobalamin biosynthesis protein CobT
MHSRLRMGMSRPSSRAMNQARTRTLNRVSRVFSGELKGVGTRVEKVVVCPQGRACTDGKTVWIPESMNDDPRLNLMMQEAVLAHEAAGHLRYTDFGAWKRIGDKIKAGEEDRLLHDFVNILEDARVNHLLSQDFAGSGKRLDATHDIFMQQHKAKWEGETNPDPARASIIAMMTEAINHEPHFFDHVPEVVAYMDEVRSHMVNAISQPSTSSVVKSAKVVLSVFREHFPESSTDSDLFGMPQGADGEGQMMDDMSPEQIERMAQEQKKKDMKPEEVSRSRFNELKKKVDEIVKKQKEAQEKAQNDEESSDEGQGASESEEGEEGEGNGNSGESSDEGATDGEEVDADGDGDGEGGESSMPTDGDSNESSEGDADGEGEGEGDSDSNNESSEMNSDSDSNDMGRGGEDLDDLFSELGDALDAEVVDAIKTTHTEEAEANQATSENIEGMEFDEGEKVEITHTTTELLAHYEEQIANYEARYNEFVQTNRTQITTLVNEMKRLIQDDSGKYARGLKKGKVDAKRLVYHKSTDKLFRKKKDPNPANVNALILIDASGSMGCGVRASAASEAAVVLTEAMTKIGWNVECVDFNSGHRDTAIRVRKSFNAPLNFLTKAAIAMDFVGSSNGDGYAVQWSLDRLNQVGGKKILFVISDGQPAGPSPHGMTEEQHLIQVVQNAPKEVGLFSIGIDGMDTSRYYPNSATCNASDLPRKVIPILRQIVRTMK